MGTAVEYKRKRGRPPKYSIKVEDMETEPMDNNYPPIKQILVGISKRNQDAPQEGYMSVAFIDNYVGEWIFKGYKLFNTHFVKEVDEGYQMIYVLVKE